MIKLVKPKKDALNLQVIQNGGIIPNIHKKKSFKTSSIVAFFEILREDDIARKTSNDSGKILNISTLISNSAWIIDFSVSNHMIFDFSQVLLIKPSS